ncbi:MAG: ferrochelatase [Gammaproteobacteria bacterium]|nr:ferrochelatase [Gammaproteobacteria bacterium]MBU2676135.1 ferrochelatase [Gammaproteobacteria bacterium]NNC57053.1 ferrochelatase [Woeseiaceae bacterium]NNL49871.1 ferrochelatase [Woeseiaceae bacterium]
MPTYESPSQFEHGRSESTGILLVNLGTPEAPTAPAVRRFLKEFLSDPRVIEYPRWLWWLILNLVILRIRPSRSAAAYRKIWTDAGSPLMIFSKAIANGIATALDARMPGAVNVELAMSYGDPSISDAVDRLLAKDATRLLVLPMYPQYSGTTTASVVDAVARKLSRLRWIPETRFINQYHDEQGYIDSLAASIREFWTQHGRGNKLMFSFHGVPKSTLLKGDPYHCQCQKTARLVAAALELGDDQWLLSFQSRVGREEWLRPYTDETVAALGKQGVDRLDVVCPGFSTDCLETLEEIAMQNARFFTESGGKVLRYIPALNARDEHIHFLTDLIEKHLGGWPRSYPQAPASRERALAMGAAR